MTAHHPNYAGAGFPWELRPEGDEALREEWATGAPASVIATRLTKRLGAAITKSSVLGRVHRLGLPGRASPIRREAAKAGAGAVTVAAQRATSEYTLRRRAKKAEGIRPAKVAMLAPVVAEAPPAPAPAIARTVQELAARVRASAMPRVAPMRAGEGCRYPLWGDERRPALRRFCDQPRRTGRDGVPNSAYCPACHALTHVEPAQQRHEDKRLQWSVASAFARAAGR